jgi:hypothetical protein
MGCLLGNFEEISSLLRGGLRRAVHARSNLLQHQHLNSSSIYARVGIEMAAIFAQSNQVFIILGESVHPLFVPSRRCSPIVVLLMPVCLLIQVLPPSHENYMRFVKI